MSLYVAPPQTKTGELLKDKLASFDMDLILFRFLKQKTIQLVLTVLSCTGNVLFSDLIPNLGSKAQVVIIVVDNDN